MSKKILLAYVHMIMASCGACGKAPTPTAPGTPSVVAIGDSETYGRGLDRGQDYPAQLQNILGWQVTNAGVSGQTTREMLNRFQTDVVAAHPTYAIITGGENDIYFGYDLSTQDASYNIDAPTGAKANLISMVAQAKAAGIKPVIGIMLPHGTIETVPARETAMYALIAWERSYFAAQGIQVADFYKALEDTNHPGYSVPAYNIDLLHPSAMGAQVMAQTAAQVLSSK